MGTCHNDPKKASTTTINERTPSGYSLFTHRSFDKTKIKLDYYRGKNCMKRFRKNLKKHATKIINYIKKEILLTNEEKKIHYRQKQKGHICKERFR